MSDHHDHHDDILIDQEDPAANPTWLMMALFVALFVVTIIGVAAINYKFDFDEMERKEIDAAMVEADNMTAQQLTKLEGPAHIREYENEFEEVEQAIVIPIDQAIDLIVTEAAGQ